MGYRVVRLAAAFCFGLAAVLILASSTLVLLVGLFPPRNTDGELDGIFVSAALFVSPGFLCAWAASHFWNAAGMSRERDPRED